jgi:uncharacterized small protein (DUF1192 family)
VSDCSNSFIKAIETTISKNTLDSPVESVGELKRELALLKGDIEELRATNTELVNSAGSAGGASDLVMKQEITRMREKLYVFFSNL